MTKEYLYKYRDITNDDYSKCYNIKNLIENKAAISSRTKFKDENDSKFNFIKPKLKELKLLRKKIPRKKLEEFNTLKNEYGFTKQGMKLFKELEDVFNKVIDGYGIYCLAGDSENNHLWENYAKNHTGFCIKFEKEKLGNDFEVYPINYQDCLAELNLIKIIKLRFGLKEEEDLGKEIHKKLFIKLEEFREEKEYRYIMSGKLEKKDIFLKSYPKEAVSEIIFGHNMDNKIKQYIIDNTNFKYSQAIKNGNKFKIVPFDKKIHLDIENETVEGV
ncbi:DUF2971 domain-containing protein [Aliarcobacter butzleri]|uniref:DUF2971 domain-containing protein n=1 Tax=Aliarcobacter butzleri TaxID=28197 RepID=UPI0021B5AD68|nr:DUF2971 domain-containing protein [Aliarcobacter butzleri]MCT7574345.1 DUF2971 domain-containing protein [Aliarcobacter butzleri]